MRPIFLPEILTRSILADYFGRNFWGPSESTIKKSSKYRIFKNVQNKLKIFASSNHRQKTPACRKWSFLQKYDQPVLVTTRIWKKAQTEISGALQGFLHTQEIFIFWENLTFFEKIEKPLNSRWKKSSKMCWKNWKFVHLQKAPRMSRLVGNGHFCKNMTNQT